MIRRSLPVVLVLGSQLLFATLDPTSAAAFRTLGQEEGSETEIVWAERPSVALDLTGLTNGQRVTFGDEVAASVDVWAAVECAAVNPRIVAHGDQNVQIRFLASWPYEPDAAGTTELVLVSQPDGRTSITGATIYLNGTLRWAGRFGGGGGAGTDDPEIRDVRAVVVHELGHTLGLAHVEDDEDATMYPFYRGPAQAVLSSDDIDGLCTLYPQAVASAVVEPPTLSNRCDEHAACPRGHWCIAGECSADARFGAPCDRAASCSERLCVDSSEEGGVCTFLCDSDRECPSDTACLEVTGAEATRVCAPLPSAGACSVVQRSSFSSSFSEGARPMFSLLLGLLLVGLLYARRRRQRGTPRARKTALLWAVVFAVGVSGCDEPAPEDADVEIDGAVTPIDSGGADAAGRDTGPPFDAGPFFDAGSPVDASPVDAGRMDAGFDAGPPCTPGEMRTGMCGFCGTQAQMCSSAGFWEATSVCIGEGECAVGSVENETDPMCATRQRICLDGCGWSGWTDTGAPGECAAGERRLTYAGCGTPGEFQEDTCSATCSWTLGTCSNPCGGTPRLSPEWEREVCIPAGPFIRGSTDDADTQPVASVEVSAFYLDAYPVTKGRYTDCWFAGVCPMAEFEGTRDQHSATWADYPIARVSIATARAFCAWDGGRRIPTEAEWEKAVRGPAPRTNPYPYDDTIIRCDLIQTSSCGFGFTDLLIDTYDGLPGSRSYYHTFLQWAGGLEPVSDLYSATYYADPGSLVDPTGPPTGNRLYRGMLRWWVEQNVSTRINSLATTTSGSIRCARNP